MPETVYIGRVQRFADSLRYGFISADQALRGEDRMGIVGKQIFVHRRDAGKCPLVPETLVLFTVATRQHNGKTQMYVNTVKLADTANAHKYQTPQNSTNVSAKPLVPRVSPVPPNQARA